MRSLSQDTMRSLSQDTVRSPPGNTKTERSWHDQITILDRDQTYKN
jgi:hypothetical protein